MDQKQYAHEPVTQEELQDYGNHVVQFSPEYSLCAGCESCSMVCGLLHDGFTGPGNGRIHIELDTRSMIHRVLSCQQCKDHPCYDACPRQGEAMRIDPDTGVVYIEESACIGCGQCQKACKFQPSRITMKKNKNRKAWKAVKCDLCRGRAEGPACIQYCPVRCIGLSDDATLLEDGLRPSEKNHE